MAAVQAPTERQVRYLNDLAVRVNQPVRELVDQYGTYTRIGSRQHLTRRDASRLIAILEERLARSPAASLDWEPSREVKGLQGAIPMSVPVHRVVNKTTGAVQGGLFRGRGHAATPHRHTHTRTGR